MTEDKHDGGKGSAAELLSAWRGAERDHAAAVVAAGVASLTSVAAEEAFVAATETAEAARLSLVAAGRAEESANRASAAATLAAGSARQDKADADDHVDRMEAAVTTAKETFHRAQQDGFPRVEVVPLDA